MRIGIIGAGMIGSTMAKRGLMGHTVLIASRHPDELEPLWRSSEECLGRSTGRCSGVWRAVMITVPLGVPPQLAHNLAQALEGKIVLDTGNAYERRDGAAAHDASTHPQGSAGWAAAMFPGARWVKAFNTVYFKTLESEAHRPGDRVGIPLASDDLDATDLAASLVRDAGLDPVIVGPLARGKEFEPGTPPYNTGMSAKDPLSSTALAGASGP
jgi:predicted dinucleotide-binding enzyme